MDDIITQVVLDSLSGLSNYVWIQALTDQSGFD